MITDMLDYRIPARLAELNTFINLAPALEYQAPMSAELRIGIDTYCISNSRLLLDVVADGAVVIARTLLQFLGLSYQKATSNSPASLTDMNWRGDDVKITDMGLPRVTAATAICNWPEGHQRAKQLLMLCFETGNKVSAHFTASNATSKNATIAELRAAFDLVIRLVNREVYSPSNNGVIEFSSGSKHGFIVMNPKR